MCSVAHQTWDLEIMLNGPPGVIATRNPLTKLSPLWEVNTSAELAAYWAEVEQIAVKE